MDYFLDPQNHPWIIKCLFMDNSFLSKTEQQIAFCKFTDDFRVKSLIKNWLKIDRLLAHRVILCDILRHVIRHFCDISKTIYSFFNPYDKVS